MAQPSAGRVVSDLGLRACLLWMFSAVDRGLDLASARMHAMHASCALLVSSRSVCRCIDHQVFACLCMRGRGRKLVAIQTEAHACQEQSLAVCRAGSVSTTPTRRWCPTFLAIVLASSSNMTRARSAAVSLGSGLPRFFVSALACKRLVNTFFAGPHVPGQGADDYRRDRVSQADRVVPIHGVLPTPRALPVVYTKHPHYCDQPSPGTHRRPSAHTTSPHDIVGGGRVAATTRPRPTPGTGTFQSPVSGQTSRVDSSC